MTLFLTVVHVLVCLILIVSVLLQRGKGAEIGAVFGGGGSSTVFGSRGAGNFLSRLTTAAAALFFGTSLSLAILGSGHRGSVFGDAPVPPPAEAPAGGGFEEVKPPVAPPDTPPAEPSAAAPAPAASPTASTAAVESKPAEPAAKSAPPATPEKSKKKPAH